MKFNKLLIILGLTCGIIFMFSCKRKFIGDTPNNIDYDTLNVVQIYHLENDSTQPSCALQVNYITPIKCDDNEIKEKINNELNFLVFEDDYYSKLSPQKALDEYSKAYIENYKKDVLDRFNNWKESGEDSEYFSYYKTIHTQVTFDKGHLLSYFISSVDYKGGANSSTYYQHLVFDLATGNRLLEEDIFEDQYKDQLVALFTAEILRQNKVKTIAELINDLGFFGIEEIPFNNNFSIDEKGITYTFNEGEIAPPSVGAISIKMQYENIMSILKQNSPISVFFNQQ